MQTAARMGLATLAFAAVHTLLATRTAKRVAARLAGTVQRDAGYRLFYNGQAVLTFTLLSAYGAALPRHTIYRLNGPAAVLMRIGQGAGLIWLLAAFREMGIARFAGLENLRAALKGIPMPPGPFGQGPESGPDGRLRTGGPYRWSRHPLNAGALPLFWMTPHMTTSRLAFNLVSTAYLVLGSLHEEVRLSHGYGARYAAYRRQGASFFMPRLNQGLGADARRVVPSAGD